MIKQEFFKGKGTKTAEKAARKYLGQLLGGETVIDGKPVDVTRVEKGGLTSISAVVAETPASAEPVEIRREE